MFKMKISFIILRLVGTPTAAEGRGRCSTGHFLILTNAIDTIVNFFKDAIGKIIIKFLLNQKERLQLLSILQPNYSQITAKL
jgi:hypothetical protein